MNAAWEDRFARWASPPSATEMEKCANAERAIRRAISNHPSLATRSIEVFAQGSYANRTNVRADSDVDICVLCRDTFFYDLEFGQGLTRENLGIQDATYPYQTFRADVEAALVAEFGSVGVTAGNKAFDIHENTYRVDADVVACFQHRRYSGPPHAYELEYGTEFLSRKGAQIINWPRQHYENGVQKNSDTSKRFKAVVRILKRLKGRLDAEVPSFLVESLAWNVPNEGYGHNAYWDDVRYVLAYLWNETRQVETCSEWTEVNDRKYLFHATQPWTREQAHAFLDAAWNHIGFE